MYPYGLGCHNFGRARVGRRAGLSFADPFAYMFTSERPGDPWYAGPDEGAGGTQEEPVRAVEKPATDQPLGPSIEPGFFDSLALIKPAGWIALAVGAVVGYKLGKKKLLFAGLGAAVTWYGGKSLGL